MKPQRFRLLSAPVMPAAVTGAWAGFVPGLFIGALLGVLITFAAGAALEWMRELSFTTGIEQQLLPFGDRTGLLQAAQDDWWLVIPITALVIGLLSGLIGSLTGALVAASFGSLLRGVEIDVEPMPEHEPAPAQAVRAHRRRKGEYRPAAGDS